jgi:hypothetical protein
MVMMMMMMVMMMIIAFVTENGTYLLIQDMNYGEGLLFSLGINFRLCQISGFEDCVTNISTKIFLADRPRAINNTDLNKFPDGIFMAFQVAYKQVRTVFRCFI